MCQYSKHIAGHACCGKDIEKLHCLHLEAIIAVDHKKNVVHNLSDIYHASQRIGRAFYEGQSPSLRRYDCERARWCGEGLLRVSADEGFYESGFADLRNYQHNA